MGQKDCAMSLIKKPCKKTQFSCNRCHTKLKNGGMVWQVSIPAHNSYWFKIEATETKLDYDLKSRLDATIDNIPRVDSLGNYDWGNPGIDQPEIEGFAHCYSGKMVEDTPLVSIGDDARALWIDVEDDNGLLTWEDYNSGHKVSNLSVNVSHKNGAWEAVLSVSTLIRFPVGTLEPVDNRLAQLIISALYKSDMKHCYLENPAQFHYFSAGDNVVSLLNANGVGFGGDLKAAVYEDSHPALAEFHESIISEIIHLQVPPTIEFTHVDI